MLFSISKSSDMFRNTELPSQNCQPHPAARWDEARRNWMIEMGRLEELFSLVNSDEVRYVVSPDCRPPHIEIDDLSQAWGR